MARHRDKRYACPVDFTLDVVGGKWKALILCLLRSEKRRFNVLLASIGRISHKVLIQQLRELERDGLVERAIIGGPRVRVDYGLTPFGMSLKPVLDGMATWAKRYHRRLGATIEQPR